MADLEERMARAMCISDGWADPDQTAHVRDGPNNTQRIPRWQIYIPRVKLMLKTIDQAEMVLLPITPAVDDWRVAVGTVHPQHPLGGHDNRRMADDAMAVFSALITSKPDVAS